MCSRPYLQALQSSRYLKNFSSQRHLELLHRSISIPPLGWFNTQSTILWYSYYKQIFYETLKYCILFQFTSPPLNYSVTIVKIKLSSNHVLKFISYCFYHKSSSTYFIFEFKNCYLLLIYINPHIIIKLITYFIKTLHP